MWLNAPFIGALWMVSIVAGGAVSASNSRDAVAMGPRISEIANDDLGEVPLPLADLPFRPVSCGWCSPTSGGNCGTGVGHIAGQNSAGSNSRGAGWHPNTCASGTCEEKHNAACECVCQAMGHSEEECAQVCGPPAGGEEQTALSDAPAPAANLLLIENLPEVWLAVRSGRVNAEHVTAEYENVELNAQRHALQVIGCEGQIVAHLPLPRGSSERRTSSD